MALNLGTTGIISGSNIKIDNASNSIALTHITASGNISASGIISASDVHADNIFGDFVEISSSIIFSSGSNIFGGDSDDTHEFTGSLDFSGSGTFRSTTQFMTESRFAGGLWVDGGQKIKFSDTNGNQWISGDENWLKFEGDNWITLYSNNSTNFADGNVGIGHGHGVNPFSGDVSGLAVKGPISSSNTITAWTGSFRNVIIMDTDGGVNPRLKVARTNNQSIDFSVTDTINTITALQDEDSNSNHDFRLVREFDGTGQNDFTIRKGSTTQFHINKDGRVNIGQKFDASNPQTHMLIVSGTAEQGGDEAQMLLLSQYRSSDFSNDYERVTIDFDRKDPGGSIIKGQLALAHDTKNYDANNGSLPLQEGASAFNFLVKDGAGNFRTVQHPNMIISSNGVGINTANVPTGSVLNTYGGNVNFDAATSPNHVGGELHFIVSSFGHEDFVISGSPDGTKVGIGEFANEPDTLLHITDDVDPTLRIEKVGDSLNAALSLKKTGGKEWIVRSNGSDHFQIRDVNNNAQRFHIDQGTGFVGIGTEDATQALTVNGAITASGAIRGHNVKVWDGRIAGYTETSDLILNQPGTNQTRLRYDTNFMRIESDKTTYHFDSTQYHVFSDNGKVGFNIGAGLPINTLSVSGSVDVNDGDINLQIGNKIYFDGANDTIFAVQDGYVRHQTNGTTRFSVSDDVVAINEGTHLRVGALANVHNPTGNEVLVSGSVSASGGFYQNGKKLVKIHSSNASDGYIGVWGNSTEIGYSSALTTIGGRGLGAPILSASNCIYSNKLTTETGSIQDIVIGPYGVNNHTLVKIRPQSLGTETGEFIVGWSSSSFASMLLVKGYGNTAISASGHVHLNRGNVSVQFRDSDGNIHDGAQVGLNEKTLQLRNFETDNDAGIKMATTNMPNAVVVDNHRSRVGINTGNPAMTLTVAGTFSASNDCGLGNTGTGQGENILSIGGSFTSAAQATLRGHLRMDNMAKTASFGNQIELGDNTNKTLIKYQSNDGGTGGSFRIRNGGNTDHLTIANFNFPGVTIVPINQQQVQLYPTSTGSDAGAQTQLALYGASSAGIGQVKLNLNALTATGSKVHIGDFSAQAPYTIPQYNGMSTLYVDGTAEIRNQITMSGDAVVRGNNIFHQLAGTEPVQHKKFAYIIASSSYTSGFPTGAVPYIEDTVPIDGTEDRVPSLKGNTRFKWSQAGGLEIRNKISSSANMSLGSGSIAGISSGEDGPGALNVYSNKNVHPNSALDEVGIHNIFVYNDSRTGGQDGYGGSIGFAGNSEHAGLSSHRTQAAIVVKNTSTADTDFNGLAFFTHGNSSPYNSLTERMVLDHTGTLTIGNHLSASGDVIAYYASDERLKYNIRTIENPIEKVSKLRGVQYQWGDNQTAYSPGSNDTGIIAQDVQKVLPEIVHQREDGHLAVKHDRLVGLLIESVKEQQKQINELKDEVKKLKGEV